MEYLQRNVLKDYIYSKFKFSFYIYITATFLIIFLVLATKIYLTAMAAEPQQLYFAPDEKFLVCSSTNR